ncbi:MAG: hypothetical protein WD771_10335 [Gemmatimonadaceae bacterium]
MRELKLPPPSDSLSHGFTRITAVRELADGRVLVLDARDRALFLADLSADAVQTVGRTGSGPAEYRRPLRLVPLAGDSTLLVDEGNQRWLMLAGPHIAVTVPPSDSVLALTGLRVFAVGHPDQFLGVVLVDRERLTGDRQRNRLAVVRVQRRALSVDTVAALKGVEVHVRTEGTAQARGIHVLEVMYSVAEQALLFADGWIALARQNPYRVDWLTPDGGLLRGPNLPWSSPTIGASEIEWFRKRMERRLGRPIPAPLEGLAFATVVPPFRENGLNALPSGHLLIARSEWSGLRGTEYDVVNRRGRLVARMSLPSNVRIVDVGAQHVFSVAVDDDGIETLRRHRWHWSATGNEM